MKTQQRSATVPLPMPEVMLSAAQEADVVTIPARTAISLEGRGAPNGMDFQRSIGALYGVAYTLKFARKGRGKGDFKLGPLEACWWTDGPEATFLAVSEQWRWRLRLAVPADVTAKELSTTIATAIEKKGSKLEGSVEATRVRLERIARSVCGRVLHVGPYAEEAASFAKIRRALAKRIPAGEHQEIYLNDPRRTKPEKLRTVLLLQVAKRGRAPLEPIGRRTKRTTVRDVRSSPRTGGRPQIR